MNKYITLDLASMLLEAWGFEGDKFQRTLQLQHQGRLPFHHFTSIVAVLVLLLLLALTNGCDRPDAIPDATQPADRLSTNRHADETKAPATPATGAASIPPIDASAINNSATPEERVINSALDSLKLRLAAKAENDPQKRAALEKQLQHEKFARQSIYAQE